MGRSRFINLALTPGLVSWSHQSLQRLERLERLQQCAISGSVFRFGFRHAAWNGLGAEGQRGNEATRNIFMLTLRPVERKGQSAPIFAQEDTTCRM